MDKIILHNKISQLVLIFLSFSKISICFAQQPTLANYSTSTSHNCINYECKKSLYDQKTLDIELKNISYSQFQDTIEKHINKIQTTQTTFPGFTSNVKWKILNIFKNKALHCHKAKAQKITWSDAVTPTTTVKYRHECWQSIVSTSKSNSKPQQKIERINDIIYTIKITRTATSCSSDQYSVDSARFDCVKNLSLLPLDDVIKKNVITITLDNEELDFVLLETPDDYELDIGNTGIQTVQDVTGDNPPQIDNPGLGGGGVGDLPENEIPELGGNDDLPENEMPELDGDNDVAENEMPELDGDDDVDKNESEDTEFNNDEVPDRNEND